MATFLSLSVLEYCSLMDHHSTMYRIRLFILTVGLTGKMNIVVILPLLSSNFHHPRVVFCVMTHLFISQVQKKVIYNMTNM